MSSHRGPKRNKGIRDRRPLFYGLTLLFIALLSAMAIARTSILLVLPLVLSYGTLFVLGVFRHNLALFAPIFVPHARVGQVVALTFDDGPDPRHTPRILDVLKAKGVRATFFCLGRNVRREPDLLLRIHGEGHQIANHTDSHPSMINFYSGKALAREILSCQEAIRLMTGDRPRYFRQVCGMTNINLGLLVGELDLTLVGWQVRSNDLRARTAEEIVERVLRRVRNGAIILFHDGQHPPNPHRNEALEKALPSIIDRLREQGYAFVTVEELHRSHEALFTHRLHGMDQ